MSKKRIHALQEKARSVVTTLTIPSEETGRRDGIKFSGGDISHPFDLQAHNHLLLGLESCGIPVLSEENLKNGSLEMLPKGLYFLIDPIDGTYNFWRGLPFVATSVALMNNTKPIFGVVRNLMSGEVYEGGCSLSAQKDGEPISLSSVGSVQHAALATGVPNGTSDLFEADSKRLSVLAHPGKVRMFGSAALSLCFLAEGKVDMYFEAGIFLWDVAAGLAIAQAAGAFVAVRGFPGDFRREVKATNAFLQNVPIGA